MTPPEPELPLLEALGRLVPELRAEVPGLDLVYLFGSHAQGRPHPGSDVDVAVLGSAPLAPLARHALAQRLADHLRRDVDLVDLASASTVMKKEVVAHGQVVFASSALARPRFEGRVLSDYVRLNEERRPVLERIAREGRVGGAG